MKPSEKLLNRLRAELGLDIPAGSVLRRTYAGRRLLAGGAFCWIVEKPEGAAPIPEIGSPYRMKDLLRAKGLRICGSWGDAEILPTDEVTKPRRSR